jgi:hypothetical protein
MRLSVRLLDSITTIKVTLSKTVHYFVSKVAGSRLWCCRNEPPVSTTSNRRQSHGDEMLDPLSVAGLTITVIDGLLKLGERTAELISNARGFDDVSTNTSEPGFRTS